MFFHGLNCFAVMKYDRVCLTIGDPLAPCEHGNYRCGKEARAALTRARICVRALVCKNTKNK